MHETDIAADFLKHAPPFDRLDEDYAPGAYLALGSAPSPEGWQVGVEITGYIYF